MQFRPRYIVGVCLVIAVLAGCVANQAYRDQDSRPWNHHPQEPFVRDRQLAQYEPFERDNPSHRFDLSYIEFDEKGDYWDRRQLGWTAEAIRRATSSNDTVLIVYVHGWQNDASTLPGHDVGKFHCLLEHLAEADNRQHRIFGVYVGWRGKSVFGGDGWFKDNSIPDALSKAVFFVPHELSFYSRKDAATRVAGMPVTEAIFQSVAAARKGALDRGRQSKTILIGHSFGALLLEKAMAQALAAKMISEASTKNGFTAPADFMVLLNSAAESIYAKEMIDMMRRRMPRTIARREGNEIDAKHPLVVSITSEADWATGLLFPVGTQLSNVTGTFRKYEWDTRYGDSNHNVSQKDYFTQTPGHNKRLISYDAKPVVGLPQPPVYQDTETCSPEMLDALRRNLTTSLSGPNGEVRFSTGSAGKETEWQLESQVPDNLQTAYWIVHVPKEIMRDHSDIFNENALALMARLFRVSNPAAVQRGITTAAPRTIRLLDPAANTESR